MKKLSIQEKFSEWKTSMTIDQVPNGKLEDRHLKWMFICGCAHMLGVVIDEMANSTTEELIAAIQDVHQELNACVALEARKDLVALMKNFTSDN